jgi:chitodextrinase
MPMLKSALATSKLSKFKLPIAVLALAMLLAAFALPKATTEAACSGTTNPSLGTDSMTLSIPSTGTYYVWTRVQPATTSNSNIYMQVDGGCADSIGGGSAIPANAWTWVNYQNGTASDIVSMSLTAGNHTVLLTGEGADLKVDSMLFLTNQCVPTGNGTNCTETTYDPPVVNITSPSPTAALSGSVTLTANATDDDTTISSVQFKVDGSSVGTVTSYPYTMAWNSDSVSNGTHTLTAVATNAQGQTTSAQESIAVNNAVACTGTPSAPTNLSAKANGTQSVGLSWSASTPSTGCSISGYQIYRGGTLVTTVSSTSFTDTNLTANTTYNYYVKAIDNAGHVSSASSTASATTAANTTTPINPTNVTATTPNASSVKLSWSASTENGSSVTGYQVYRNNLLYATVTSGTDYTDNNVRAGTSYNYAVSAYDSTDNQSAVVRATPYTVTTPSASTSTLPTTPTNLKVVVSTTTSASIQWTASRDALGIAGYHIYRNGGLVATVGNVTSFTEYCLAAGTSYEYTVAAYDSSANVSSQSSPARAQTTQGKENCSDGDLNADGKVSYLDLSTMLSHWGQSVIPSQGDLSDNGTVDMPDFIFMLQHWGN